MRLIILLATLSIALPFAISKAAGPYGNAVAQRFLERPTSDGTPQYTIPSEAPPGKAQDATSLRQWAVAHDGFAKGYAKHIVALDILYLGILGAFLGAASAALAREVAWPTKLAAVPIWLWWTLPLTYIASDLAEDILIFGLLNGTLAIQTSTFGALEAFRAVKLTVVTFSILQVLLLSVLSFWRPVRFPAIEAQ